MEDKSFVDKGQKRQKPGSNVKRHGSDKLIHQKKSAVKRRLAELEEEDLDSEMDDFEPLTK